jgi:hypothetical protein
MKIEILSHPPISGSIAERQFNCSARTNLWARFEDPDGDAWVGVFGSGVSRFDAVIPFGDDPEGKALVVAGGQGYVLDLRAQRLVRQTSWEDADAAISVPNGSEVMVARAIYLLAVGYVTDQYVTRSEQGWYDASARGGPGRRVALDGIVLTSASSASVAGRVWEGDGWFAFTVPLPSLAFQRGELLAAAWDAFDAVAPAG